MSKKIHKISWEVGRTKTKRKPFWAKVLGYTPTETHLYTMELDIKCDEGDSTDTLLTSILNQLKAHGSRGEHGVKAHNGTILRRMVRDDLV